MTDPEIDRELKRHLYRPLWLRVVVWALLPFVWTLQALRTARLWVIVAMILVVVALSSLVQLRRQLAALVEVQAAALEELECGCPETGDYLDPEQQVLPETLPLPTSESM